MAAPSLVNWYRPHDKQILALSVPQTRQLEMFFGGAKGGGKSLCLLLLFVQQEMKYGRAARGIIFRRTQPEFTELRKTSTEMFRGHAEWKSKDMTWVFKSGATLRMAHLDTEREVGKYTGQEYTYIAFDELTEWASGAAYSFMKTCLRNTMRIPGLVASSGNPGRPGHHWVKYHWIDDATPMKLKPSPQMDRVFIPSRLEDNPHLMKDGNYEQILLHHHNPQEVEALRWGRWDVFVGQAFPEWRENLHVTDPPRLDPSWPRWASLDWGDSKPYCMLFYCGMPSGRIIIYREAYGAEEGKINVGTNEPANIVARDQRRQSAGDDVQMVFIDSQMHTPGPDGSTFAQAFEREGWVCINANKPRLPGKAAVHRWLGTIMVDGYPALQVSTACPHLIRTFPGLILNTRRGANGDDVDTEGEDHAYDSARYGLDSPMANAVQAQAVNEFASGDALHQMANRAIAERSNYGLNFDPNHYGLDDAEVLGEYI